MCCCVCALLLQRDVTTLVCARGCAAHRHHALLRDTFFVFLFCSRAEKSQHREREFDARYMYGGDTEITMGNTGDKFHIH